MCIFGQTSIVNDDKPHEHSAFLRRTLPREDGFKGIKMVMNPRDNFKSTAVSLGDCPSVAPSSIMYSTTSQVPAHSCFTFRTEIRELQYEAITEVVTMPASEKRARLGSYGLSKPCRDYSTAVLQDIATRLSRWASLRGLVIQDLEQPWFRPEAFRLQRGAVLWPSENCTVLLLPLTHITVEVDLIPRGSNEEVTFSWDPNAVVHLTETGLRFKGRGSLRLIYIMMRIADSSASSSYVG